MYGGERRPPLTPRPQPERTGSPHINIYGPVENMNAGTNHGTLNQNVVGALSLSLLRIVWDTISPLLARGVIYEDIAPSAGIGVDTQDNDFEIVSMTDYREPSLRPRAPTTYEIYVRTLLDQGHGLPCWEPQPSEPKAQPYGVVPGDVGTYTQEAGFQRIFNLWDRQAMHRLREIAETTHPDGEYQDLTGRIITLPKRLHKGETLVRGASTHKQRLSPPLVGFMYQFFRVCPTQPGALLALTSSADKDVTDNPIAMEEYIKRNTEAIYRYASSFRVIGEKESLYIITGCIKSDSWAMAAYDTHEGPVGGSLCLVPVHGVKYGGPPMYEWRSQFDTSRARFGRSSKKRVKDQSLFLQGFKVAFSPSFHARVKASISNDGAPGASDPTDRGTDRHYDPSGPSNRDPPFTGQESMSGGGGGRWTAPVRQSGPRNHALPISLQERLSQDSTTSSICPTPCSLTSDDSGVHLSGDTSVDCTSVHPSDVVNAHLLKQTGCEIAICHDDAWRFLLKSCHALVAEEAIEVADIPARIGDSGHRAIAIQNGVAFLLPADFNGKGRDTNLPSENLEATTPKTAPPPRNRLTVVPNFAASSVVEKRRSYESPQSTLTLKPSWNCSTPVLPCAADTTSMLLQTDVVIFVLGTTGSGRSSFINALVPGEMPRMEMGDSGSLEACTTAVDHQVLDEWMLRVALGFTKNYRVVLVDTPGFNSSRKSDSSMLRDIESWSQKWIPRGGCRGGVVLLHDITTPPNERLAKADLVALSASFTMVIATSKWKYEGQDKAQKLHDALASKWEKPSKKAKFYPFKESKDAPGIIGCLLSEVENANSRVDFSSVFKAMADVHERREADLAKREQGWKGIVRSLAFWKRW